MEGYSSFVRSLVRNYMLGSLMAVLGVGGTFIFSTLRLTWHVVPILLFTLVFSLCVMMFVEFLVFRRHLRPLRTLLKEDSSVSLTQYQQAFKHVHKMPFLSVGRIMGPHWLGFLVPGLLISVVEIHDSVLRLPYEFVWLAVLGTLLVAGMHAMIEFFLTTRAVQPILQQLGERVLQRYHTQLSLDGHVMVSVQRKFLIGAVLIGTLPLLLFSVATQVRLSDAEGSVVTGYWLWASSVIAIGIAFSLIGAWLVARDVRKPIVSLETLMQGVEHGDLKIQAPDFYSDEFSRLVVGFNSMVRSLYDRDQMNSQLIDSYFATLAAALDARDTYTAGHSTRVAHYAVEIGRRIQLDSETLNWLRKSALLHDIGKIGIRDEVLLKDGKLTDEEFALIQQHPVIGETILQQVQPEKAMRPLLPGVRSHHERYDGRGYPDGLRGEDIPLFGRVLAVADAYDAMTSNRPYRNGMSSRDAAAILHGGRGTQWDAGFVDCFLAFLEEQSRSIDNTEVRGE